MPDIGWVDGGAWVPLDEAPEIPDDLPKLPETGQAPKWHASHGPEGERLYAAVCGDCGTEGPYLIGVWCLPRQSEAEDGVGVLRGHEPRYPTFDEWCGLVNAVCLAGVMMACCVISGGTLHEQATGRGLILTQSMIIGNTPAAQRWALANPGTLPEGGGVVARG